MFNKRGEEVGRSRTIELLLGLAVLIVLVGVIVVFVEKEDVFTRRICQMSVYLSDQTVGVFHKLGIGGIYCNTYYKEFEDLKKNEFLEKLAENMRQCWWMWGEGKLDPSGPNLVKWSDYQCFNCYVIEPLRDVPEITLEELENHLQREYIPDSDTIYWNYFKGFNNNKIIFNFPSLGDPEDPSFKEKPLFRNELYSITFVENTEPSVITRVLTGTTLGATYGAVGCAFVGGPLAALACGIKGGILGGIILGVETTVENYLKDDSDGIMISEFNKDKNVCSGEIG